MGRPLERPFGVVKQELTPELSPEPSQAPSPVLLVPALSAASVHYQDAPDSESAPEYVSASSQVGVRASCALSLGEFAGMHLNFLAITCNQCRRLRENAV